MNLARVLAGVLAGIATGAALGVLFAPKKGDRIRRDLRRKGEDMADALSDRLDALNSELRHALDRKAVQAKHLPKHLQKLH